MSYESLRVPSTLEGLPHGHRLQHSVSGMEGQSQTPRGGPHAAQLQQHRAHCIPCEECPLGLCNATSRHRDVPVLRPRGFLVVALILVLFPSPTCISIFSSPVMSSSEISPTDSSHQHILDPPDGLHHLAELQPELVPKSVTAAEFQKGWQFLLSITALLPH